MTYPSLADVTREHDERIEVYRFAVGDHDRLPDDVIRFVVFVDLHGHAVVRVQDVVFHAIDEGEDVGLGQGICIGRQIVAEDDVAAKQGTGRHAIDSGVDAGNRLTVCIDHADEFHEGRFAHDPYRAGFIGLFQGSFCFDERVIFEFVHRQFRALFQVVDDTCRLTRACPLDDGFFQGDCHGFGYVVDDGVFKGRERHVFYFQRDGNGAAQLEVAEGDGGAERLVLQRAGCAFCYPGSYRFDVTGRNGQAGCIGCARNERQDIAIRAHLFDDPVERRRWDQGACVGRIGYGPKFCGDCRAPDHVVHKGLAVFFAFNGLRFCHRFFSHLDSLRLLAKINLCCNFVTFFKFFLFCIESGEFVLQGSQVYGFVAFQCRADFFLAAADFSESFVHVAASLEICFYNQFLFQAFFSLLEGFDFFRLRAGHDSGAVIGRHVDGTDVNDGADVLHPARAGLRISVFFFGFLIDGKGKGHFADVAALDELVDVLAAGRRRNVCANLQASFIYLQLQRVVLGPGQDVGDVAVIVVHDDIAHVCGRINGAAFDDFTVFNAAPARSPKDRFFVEDDGIAFDVQAIFIISISLYRQASVFRFSLHFLHLLPLLVSAQVPARFGTSSGL
nr:MAG TPA: hypothetical protein [Caudoviricetes sp.]